MNGFVLIVLLSMFVKMSKLFKSINVRPILTIGDILYGTSQHRDGYYIHIRKRKKQWVKRHGPFKDLPEAESFIWKALKEYNAVREAQNSRKARSQI